MREKITIDEFIKKSKEIHGERYNYSLVKYVNCKTKVKIICTEHGEFEQSPEKHLMGQKCKLCSIKKSAEKRSKNTACSKL